MSTTSAFGPTRARHGGHGSRRAAGNTHWRGGGISSGRSSPANAPATEGGQWERGGHRGSTRGRGRGRGTKPNLTWRKDENATSSAAEEGDSGVDEQTDDMNEEEEDVEDGAGVLQEEPVLTTPEDKERFWKQARRSHNFTLEPVSFWR
jgi:hypothetical protein